MAENGRLNNIIAGLDRLQREANEILDGHVRVLMHSKPYGTSFGLTKMETFLPAGTTLNYAAALKIVRDSITDSGPPNAA
jgi:hypothetical protein